MKLTVLAGAVSAVALLAAPALASTAPNAAAVTQSQPTIVEAAVASPAHTTLVAAVQAAGLVETLSGPGPFTVFAPTNDAFAALPAGTVETLLQPANRAILTKVLTYHVVAGRVAAADVIALIQAGGGSAAIGGVATVVQADLNTSNGVIHVTDAVSIPQ